ncbi:MAG: aspartate/glutamate racemase family protein [Acidimicrobiales bacterium]
MSLPLEHDERPIGMFDSGFGGLTVARAVIDLLPDEHLVYVGDTGRYPYGPRPLSQVRDFAHQITRHLVDEEGVKLVVVACNTASAAALASLQADTPVPVLGVIEPGVRSLVVASRTGRIGVIGTVGTIGSGAYQEAVLPPIGRSS